MDYNPSRRRKSQSQNGNRIFESENFQSKITNGLDETKQEEPFGKAIIMDVPLDILNLIFDLLLPVEIFRLASTCKAIHQAFLHSSSRKKIFFEVIGQRSSSWFSSKQVMPVMCHLGILYGNSFYVVGGDCPQNQGTANFGAVLPEVQKFDFVTRRWEKERVEGVQALTEHAGVVYQNKVFIYGGVRPGSVRSGDLLEFNLKHMIFQTVTAHGESPRGSCFACAIHNNRFYVVGGWNPDCKTERMVIHQYYFVTQNWSEATPANEAPLFRRAHKSVRFGKYLYIFGGFMPSGYTNELLQLDLTTLSWATIRTTGAVPSPRSRVAVCLHTHKMYIHGGWNGTTLSDFFELDLNTFIWKELPVNNGPKLAQHSMVVWNNKMFIFGGNDGERACNTLYGMFL